MKLVVDTNRVIAALIRDSSSREIITNKDYNFITPNFTLEEINKHKKEIIEKAGIDEASFDLLMVLIFYDIEIAPYSEYKEYLSEANKLLDERDIKDVPFLALALSRKIDGIWTDDKDFSVQNKIKIFKTKDLI